MAPGGERVLVPDLETLWTEAARLAGTPIDPLSPHALGSYAPGPYVPDDE
jgi:hypothetical protein